MSVIGMSRYGTIWKVIVVLLEDNNTQQAKTCKNVDFCQGFP